MQKNGSHLFWVAGAFASACSVQLWPRHGRSLRRRLGQRWMGRGGRRAPRRRAGRAGARQVEGGRRCSAASAGPRPAAAAPAPVGAARYASMTEDSHACSRLGRARPRGQHANAPMRNRAVARLYEELARPRAAPGDVEAAAVRSTGSSAEICTTAVKLTNRVGAAATRCCTARRPRGRTQWSQRDGRRRRP
jgi:hypothetical protein